MQSVSARAKAHTSKIRMLPARRRKTAFVPRGWHWNVPQTEVHPNHRTEPLPTLQSTTDWNFPSVTRIGDVPRGPCFYFAIPHRPLQPGVWLSSCHREACRGAGQIANLPAERTEAVILGCSYRVVSVWGVWVCIQRCLDRFYSKNSAPKFPGYEITEVQHAPLRSELALTADFCGAERLEALHDLVHERQLRAVITWRAVIAHLW